MKEKTKKRKLDRKGRRKPEEKGGKEEMEEKTQQATF